MAASFLINKFIRFYLTEALRSKLFSGQFVILKSGENVRKFDESTPGPRASSESLMCTYTLCPGAKKY